MCGIAGLIRLNGRPVDAGELDRLTDALAHRGPEARGVFIKDNVGIGHRRLKIVDLSEGGAQPRISEDGNAIISFNGEIYNFQEKRAMLEAREKRFRSKSDTEVLLKLYEEYGLGCIEHLRGQFAFAIYDAKKGKLFLVRDRVGKKPIKYFCTDGVFAFASELKALKTLKECPREVNYELLHHTLTLMYVAAPETGIQGIKKLPAGHMLTLDVRSGSFQIERYWSLKYETQRDLSVQDWEKQIVDVLDESVRLRMIADVPLGAFLSGGLDSATIVALMSKHSSSPVKTFSIGSDDPKRNELPDAALTAKAFGTDHHPIELKADIVTLLPALVHTFEEPYADPSSIPTYLIAQATKQFVTVALNGDGGDENFAGYVRYPILQFSEKWRKIPVHGVMRPLTALYHSLAKSTLSYRSLRFEDSIHLPWEKRFLQYISFFTEEEKRAIYADGFAADFPRTDDVYAARTFNARGRADSLLHKAMSMDIETYLADDLMPKVDLGAMAHALEARSPFLDHHLLELTASMPAEYKLQGRTTKWIFREIIKDFLPPEILNRPKRGFRLPLDKWFRGPLKNFVRDSLLSDSSTLSVMMDRTKLEKFLDEYFASRIDFSDHIWALLWLQEWLKQQA